MLLKQQEENTEEKKRKRKDSASVTAPAFFEFPTLILVPVPTQNRPYQKKYCLSEIFLFIFFANSVLKNH